DNEKLMNDNQFDYTFIQDNQSLSVETGVIRGLHYQLDPKAQTKLIRVISGAIYDVILDIRKSSQTFGQGVGGFLSEHNRGHFLGPKGLSNVFVPLYDRKGNLLNPIHFSE
ncbi:dTDP-4-keto-6-deoxy-D-glucose epimerase, partial [Paenibacillus sp. 28ISP30-2]|nr:dTDP-4-keto-6-deoxy-D-glucose epimerase [Paenibacillus sp. 28ISP30-2]